MLFSKRKKLARDREAGLIFRWRGGTGTNRGGFTLAFLLTAAFFALAFTVVAVRVKPTLLPSRYQASVIQLGMVEDDMAWWLEKKSPYLEPWYDDLESLADGSVDMKLRAMMELSNAQPVRWRKPEVEEVPLDLPSLYAKGEVEYPASRKEEISLEHKQVVDWQLSLKCSHPQQLRRLPKRRNYPLMLGLPESWYGKSLQLVVTLNSAGNVISTIPLHWSDDKTERLIETWMQSIQFNASTQQVQIIIVELEVGAKVKEVSHD